MSVPAIDLRLLRQFVAVAEELHFRRAAARLNISQPPLTAAVKRLEEEIGAVLIERGRKTVALTPAGRTLRDEARKVLAMAEAAIAATRDAAAGRAGTVRLSYVGSAMYGRLPKAIGAFRRQTPGVRLVLRELTTAAQVAGLRDGSIDLAVLIPPLADPGGLETRPFDSDRLALALPADHPLARTARLARTVRLADVAGEPFVLWPALEGQGFHARALRLCARAGFQPRIVQEAYAMHSVLSLVAAGAGIALVPSRMARLHPDSVVFRRIDDEDAQFQTVLAWPSARLEPAAAALVASIA